jgi:hypothetical protein
MKSGHSLTLYDSVLGGAAPLGNITTQMRGWKRSIRDCGGYWLGEADFWLGDKDSLVSRAEALNLFLNGIGLHVVETAGAGKVAWEGRISSLELTLDGVTVRRALDQMGNKVKLIYSRMGSNLLTNGSAEGAVGYNWMPGGAVDVNGIAPCWFGSPPTWFDWVSHGDHSFIMQFSDQDNAEVVTGLRLLSGTNQVVDGSRYQLRGMVRVDNCDPTGYGVWVEVYGVYGQPFYKSSAWKTAGTYSIDASFDVRGFTGVVTVGIFTELHPDSSGSTWYADGFDLREAGTRMETGWMNDDTSVAQYGAMERIVLEGGMTDAEAIARQTRVLHEMAWPRSKPIAFEMGENLGRQDGLKVGVSGYVHTLSNKQITAGGVLTCAEHVAALIAQSQFVTLGYCGANTLSIYVEDQDPIRIWDGLEQVLKDGSTTGARWKGGVYAGRKFNYEAASTALAYVCKKGVLYTPEGSLIDPQLVLPGIVRLDDIPTGPSPTIYTSALEDDARYVYVPEWEWDSITNITTPVSFGDYYA